MWCTCLPIAPGTSTTVAIKSYSKQLKPWPAHAGWTCRPLQARHHLLCHSHANPANGGKWSQYKCLWRSLVGGFNPSVKYSSVVIIIPNRVEHKHDILIYLKQPVKFNRVDSVAQLLMNALETQINIINQGLSLNWPLFVTIGQGFLVPLPGETSRWKLWPSHLPPEKTPLMTLPVDLRDAKTLQPVGRQLPCPNECWFFWATLITKGLRYSLRLV